jgi:hypothetical protein
MNSTSLKKYLTRLGAIGLLIGMLSLAGLYPQSVHAMTQPIPPSSPDQNTALEYCYQVQAWQQYNGYQTSGCYLIDAYSKAAVDVLPGSLYSYRSDAYLNGVFQGGGGIAYFSARFGTPRKY